MQFTARCNQSINFHQGRRPLRTSRPSTQAGYLPHLRMGRRILSAVPSSPREAAYAIDDGSGVLGSRRSGSGVLGSRRVGFGTRGFEGSEGCRLGCRCGVRRGVRRRRGVGFVGVVERAVVITGMVVLRARSFGEVLYGPSSPVLTRRRGFPPSVAYRLLTRIFRASGSPHPENDLRSYT